MLFSPSGATNQCACRGRIFREKKLVEYHQLIKQQQTPDYAMNILSANEDSEEINSGERIPLYEEAVGIV